MTEFLNNSELRKQTIKDVIRKLHDGHAVEDVKADFDRLVRQTGSLEVAQIEQELIAEGMPVEEIQRLCDVHVAVFRDALDRQDQPQAVSGHPLETFMMENRLVTQLLDEIEKTSATYTATPNKRFWSVLYKQVQQLQEYTRHYLRKENLLFPYLEKYGFEGPSKVMWGIHDEIRAKLKALNTMLTLDNAPDAAEFQKAFEAVKSQILDMIYKEEHILFPTSSQMLKPLDWQIIESQEEELGYFMVKPTPAPQEETKEEQPAQAQPALPVPEGALPMHTGALTLEQIDLMVNHMPIDVTFVDENDEVRYYSRSLERIFARSSAIIGRKVQNCHPPHSIARVQRIVDDFRSGVRDTAEFWIQMQGKFIHIRYFAMRDADGKFRGTLEVSQDVTGIRALSGERRLLDDE